MRHLITEKQKARKRGACKMGTRLCVGLLLSAQLLVGSAGLPLPAAYAADERQSHQSGGFIAAAPGEAITDDSFWASGGAATSGESPAANEPKVLQVDSDEPRKAEPDSASAKSESAAKSADAGAQSADTSAKSADTKSGVTADGGNSATTGTTKTIEATSTSAATTTAATTTTPTSDAASSKGAHQRKTQSIH